MINHFDTSDKPKNKYNSSRTSKLLKSNNTKLYKILLKILLTDKNYLL